MLMTISTFINFFLYDVRTISLMRYLSLLFQIIFYFSASFIFAGHYLDLMLTLGEAVVVFTIAPYVFFGLLLSLYFLIIKRDGSKALIALSVSFIPTALLSVNGLTSLLMVLLALFVRSMEKSHRMNMVKIMAYFSKEFSPLYQKRLDNKRRYNEYKSAYRLLDLMEPSDFSLLKEIEVTERDKRTGLTTKVLYRTFKINGVIGTTRIKDDLYISPQRKWYSGFLGGKV